MGPVDDTHAPTGPQPCRGKPAQGAAGLSRGAAAFGGRLSYRECHSPAPAS